MSFPIRRGLVAAAVSALAAGVAVLPAQATEDVSWYIGPSPVDPGGQLYAKTQAANGGCTPSTPVTSAGLVEPLRWTIGGNFGTYAGYGTAVKKPGKYVATFTCTNGKKTSRTFVVKGTPEPTPTKTPTPTTTKPKPPAPKPKPQVVVKPKGAPATGGGYSAA
ncbi:hypothetical protein SAMN05421504_101498 [Amycolatopsis xylanica]|uniref:Ig-like domain-containing protein n=1 Tax=Amycolatopsis xylanica TaxID=589385 RepID=A0A1H2T9C2_9PSEU|nr:hypothetical protein [Amycolatopsis xylanica]SDW40546.1 hypothetical protein SAMN05421504_101498 [Amycolatopsis xylanica]